MKRVLFYLHFIKFGGAEKVALEYIKGLIKMGYSVDLAIDYNMGEDNDLLVEIPEGVNYYFVKSERASKFIYSLRTKGKKNKIYNLLLYFFLTFFDFLYFHLKFKNKVSKEQYDASITFYQFLPSYITKFKNINNNIIWLHGSVEHFFLGMNKFAKIFFKKNYFSKLQKYDFIVTVAEEMREQLLSLYPRLSSEKVKNIYNPLNFDDIHEKSEELSRLDDRELELLKEDYICTVSRIDENQKDILTLIKAYHELYSQRSIKESLYIIGDGPDRQMLEEYVKKSGIENKVKFLGRKTNPYIWVRNSNLFVLSSKFEGFGLVLVEAMALERLVISSNCKVGPSEILQNGECGILVETGNFKEMADSIYFGLTNNKEKEKLIKKASIRIKSFKLENSLNKLLKLF